MARFKDFGKGKEDKSISSDPIKFALHGQEFECYPRLQGKTLLEFVELANADDAGSSAKVTRIFFEKVMNAETYARFNEVLDSPDTIVTVESLGEIIGWLIEEYSGRPNSQPEA
jgi:hypothetical protein